MAADALRSVPGLAIARSGPVGAQTQIRMRGAEANQVLVLIDGVEANDLATDDEFSFEHLTTFDIDRIEVVRGPQSALWGSDALAGVINVVTRRPERPLETEGYAEGGSDGVRNGGARIGLRSGRGSLSLPLRAFAPTAPMWRAPGPRTTATTTHRQAWRQRSTCCRPSLWSSSGVIPTRRRTSMALRS